MKKTTVKRVVTILNVIVIIGCAIFLGLHFWGGKENSNVSQSGDNYYLSWSDNGEASYNVYINGTLVDTTTDKKLDITKYLVDDGTYNLTVKKLASDSSETDVIKENYKYAAQSKSDFKRKTFFMNGKIYDYNIESLEEYKMFVWYTVLYRNSGVKWFNSCNSINVANVNRLTFEYINSYPEYDAVEARAIYASRFSGNIYRISNLEYYLPLNFTLSTANSTISDDNSLFIYKQDKKQYDKETVFNRSYEAMGESSERTFPIETSGRRKVKVYNTEQLFMVTSYGAEPVFDESATVARACYENAKTILRQINNSDDLTDYQKALNIYRYICMNVKYDHILFDFMADVAKNSSVERFGKFSCFYIEGVLYDLDNQVAVCDGLSKAYALMCNIEGIETTKVNGIAGDSIYTSEKEREKYWGNHAWNKIKIDNKYYMVDTTWGTVAVSNADIEMLSHKYFLISEQDMSSTHKATFEVPTAKTQSLDYYANDNLGDATAYITSDADFAKLKQYITGNPVYGIEIKLSDSVLNSFDNTDVEKTRAYLKSKLTSVTVSLSYYLDLDDGVYLIRFTRVNVNTSYRRVVRVNTYDVTKATGRLTKDITFVA